MRRRGKGAACPRCRGADIQTTSNTPGDGRRMFVCRQCRFFWTHGKRKGEGYRRA